jgi:hypothetical protein
MKAIVENPLNVNHSPVAISLYVNMLNKIVQCNDEKELREAMKFISMDYPVTFNSFFVIIVYLYLFNISSCL